MTKGRLEAFSDGVIAIIITIMVLELKPPHGDNWAALGGSVAKGLLIYVLSFVYIAIYWNNHHHMLHACTRVSGGVLWANTHLLFWLSLVPFATTWMAEADHLAPVPTAAYGTVLFLAGIAFNVLKVMLIRTHGQDSPLARAVGRDLKGNISGVLNGIAIPLALWKPQLAIAVYVAVGLIWLVPDRRVERVLAE